MQINVIYAENCIKAHSQKTIKFGSAYARMFITEGLLHALD